MRVDQLLLTLHILAAATWIGAALAAWSEIRRALSASRDVTLKVWDLETGRALSTLAGHSDSVLCVGVTSDGRRAISGPHDKTLKVGLL